MHYPHVFLYVFARVVLAAICLGFLPEMDSLCSGIGFEWIGDQNEITPGTYPPGWAFNDGVMWRGLSEPSSELDDAIFGGGYVPPAATGPYRWYKGGTIFFSDFTSLHASLKDGSTHT